MVIKYEMLITVLNLIDDSTSKFSKQFEKDIEAFTDSMLYNNHHILESDVYILDMFKDEIEAYCTALGIEEESVQLDEFEMASLTDRVDVYFEFSTAENEMSMKPTLKCYIHPKNDMLKVPELVGKAYDSTTIIWTWPKDEGYAHYLIEEPIDVTDEENRDKIVAHLPIGVNSYTETNLEPDTAYTRRLINYTDEQTSSPSAPCTVMTETVTPVHSLEEYNVPKNYDFTTDDSERFMDTERFKAFHSGVGDFSDLKVYKQMDADFYQKFKAYFEITGRRIQREKRYDQVGFNYKVCLEAMETINEQEGEVTFDVNVYPREWVTIEDYMWATKPINIKAKLQATVFLRKEIEASETQEVLRYKPKYKRIKNIEPVPDTTELKGNPLNIVVVWDVTQSMFFTAGDASSYTISGNEYVGIQKGKDALDNAITRIRNAAQSLTTPPTINIKLITFDDSSHNQGDYGTGASIVPSQYNSNGNYHYTNTNWDAALVEATSVCSSLHSSSDAYTAVLFMSDGAHNVTNSVSQSAIDGLKNVCDKIIPIISNRSSNGNLINYSNIGGGSTGRAITDGSGNGDRISHDNESGDGKFHYNGLTYIKWGNSTDLENSIAQLYNEVIKVVSHDPIIYYTYEFAGWKPEPEDKTHIENYDLDSVKKVTVTIDDFEFEFNNTVTPTEYVRAEKRTIIPAKNHLLDVKVSNTSLYDLIMAKVRQTPEWLDGYNKTIGTIEAGGESDKFLITNVYIWDTYQYADEDLPIHADLGTLGWEDGMEGSVNFYTDIDKVGTTTYGDDCYLVSKSNYMLVQGYTDAIIYDGIRFVNSELNAYDRPMDILVSAVAGVYSNMLHNRKRPSLAYDGTAMSHCVDLIQKDRDIVLEGADSLKKPGDYQIFAPITKDITASISEWYNSPVLNYRFNLEDPDAKTPLYEILPKCHPEDNFRNVVILHIYYAKNVWITNTDNYVAGFGDDPIATTSSEYIPLVEGLYKWTLKEWQDGIGKENGWFIDDYLWFMAKPMRKTQKYYDELPGPGMETFYGLVNGRYRTDNQDGKQDLRVDTPQFNIPTTVDLSTVRIYIMITEFYPDSALVGYRWEHPFDRKDSITQVNGDYVTFFSDSITWKDVEYMDVIATINRENQEIFDQKTREYIYELTKPNSVYEYINYYLKVETDNSDVLALRYPTEITFNEEGKSSVGVAFKGVVNATSKWSPRIHNGYYYLNQHEYFAFSEFNVEANFDTYEEENYKKINGYVSIDVLLRHKAKPIEHYSITKDTRAELLQDEETFQWVNGKGLTLKPTIDGIYYREYPVAIYYSPIIMFRNTLTTAGALRVGYSFTDDSTLLVLEVRSYNLEEGKWNDWAAFTNNTVPSVPLSSAYQIRTTLQASVTNEDFFLEDYMCCYLDWKDDMNEANTVNIVTITDHMTVGPYETDGIYVSKILDYGCVTGLKLDIFESLYKSNIQVFIAFSDDDTNSLLIENVIWTSCIMNHEYHGRYFRYKIVIPYGEKLYWLHKQIQTKKTTEILPYISSIAMTGTYAPSDVTQSFINTEAFEIPKDGNEHVVFERVTDIIGADVLARGYTEDEIETVSITCTTPDVELIYDRNLDNRYPTAYLNTPISAKSDIDIEILIKNTPYIFTEEISEKDQEHTVIKIKGTPQQFCPIVVEDDKGNCYTQLNGTDSFALKKDYLLTDETKYVTIPSNRYDPLNLHIYLDGTEMDSSLYNIVNHLVIFKDFITASHTVTVEYCILYSFIPVIDRKKDTTVLYFHTGVGIDMPVKAKVYFETNKRNNKFVANELSLNPIYRTDYEGFIYLTDDHNEPYEVRIFCNPKRLKAGGFDSVDISIEVIDVMNNPVISKDVAVDCGHGILNADTYTTDMNGVVHIVYESSYTKCTDTFKASVLKDDGTVVEQSIEIINE